MADFTFKVTGLKELDRKLRELGDAAAGRLLKASAKEAMLPVREAAIAAAPVGDQVHTTYRGRVVTPGFTRRNINLVAIRNTYNRNRARVVVGPSKEAFYATQFVERGTSRMPARPWLGPAFSATKGIALKRFKDSLKRRIERLARRRT